MSDRQKQDVEEGLAELEALVRSGGTPNRYHARALLIPYGELSLSGSGAAVSDETEARLRRAAAALGKGWAQAIEAELALACAEHIHSTDPRYIDLPAYDWAYTLAARARLEARLAAADRWGMSCPRALRAAVDRADEQIAAAGHPFKARLR